MAQSITHALDALLATTDDVIVFGEDVGQKAGAYGVRGRLQKRHGSQRVVEGDAGVSGAGVR